MKTSTANGFQLLIKYTEYCKITAQTAETNKPDWFDMDQYTALSIIYKNMTQTHIFPVDKAMFKHMKEQYAALFTKALSWQIKYVNDNQDLYDNPTGYMSSRQVGTFNRGALNSSEIDKLLNILAPKAQYYLEQMGWLYKSLSDRYELSQFYVAEVEDDYATQSYVQEKMEEANEYSDLGDTEVKEYVAENYQTKLPDVIKDRYLHTNEETGDLEWVEAGSVATKVDDVKVNGESVVVSKVANIDLTPYAKLETTDAQTISSSGATALNLKSSNTASSYLGLEGAGGVLGYLGVKDGNPVFADSLFTNGVKNLVLTETLDNYIKKDGTTSITGDITIEKETPELKLNATGTNDLSGISFLENNVEKRNLIYDNNEGNDRLYFTDGTNELVVPKANDTIATVSEIPTNTSQLTNNSGFITNEVEDLVNYYSTSNTYSKTQVDEKIGTLTGLYLGYLDNNVEEEPEDISAWIEEHLEDIKPTVPTSYSNNDYIFVNFTALYKYWRCRCVISEGTRTWKKDLEFDTNLEPVYIELYGTEGTLTQEQRALLMSGNATSNYIWHGYTAEDEGGTIMKCTYYKSGATASYAAVFATGVVNEINIDLTDGTWTSSTETIPPTYIELYGTSGVLTQEDRDTLNSGNPTNNYIWYGESETSNDGLILKCTYYNAGGSAIYSASSENKTINSIEIDLVEGAWTFSKTTLADSTDLTTETTARTNADTTLQSNIDSEASTRSKADETLQSNIDIVSGNLATEISERKEAITTEAASRATGDDNTLTSAKEYADGLVTSVLKAMYPIGSIYVTENNSFDPAVQFGFGTWEKITDRFLVGAGNTYTTQSTGGSADAIVVSHTHTNSVTTNGAHTHTRGSMDITGTLGHALVPVDRDKDWPYKTGCFSGSTTYPWGYDANDDGTAWGGKEIVFKASNNWSGSTSEAGGHTHTVTIDSTGNDGTNANLPPYYAVFMWRRTA